MNEIVPFENISVINCEPTNFCPLKCKSCGDLKVRPIGFMTEDLCNKITSQCKGKEIRLFMSGEPLCHPLIDNLIRITRRYSEKVIIHTNAIKLDEKMSNRLIDSGLTHISISFDGLTKEEYESNRCGSNFELVSENIRTFIKINKYKIKLALQRIIKQGENNTNLKQLFPGANSYSVITRHSWDIRNTIEGHKPESIYDKYCFFPWNYMSILCNGDVNLCCADLNGRCIIGNVMEETLPEIWNNNIFRSIRKRMINRQPIPEICSGCERYKY